MTYPAPADVILYPAWWTAATTLTLTDIREATATFSPADAQIFPYGISFPDSVRGVNVFLPWSQVQGISD
jgi:hypothetical protein